MKSYRLFLRTLGSFTCLGLASAAMAASKTWIGGNVDWIDATGAANWSPSGEPSAADSAIFNTANTVNLGSNNEVLSLNLSGGIDLDTNTHNLLIDGGFTASGSSTNLIISGSSSTFTARNYVLGSGSTLSMRDGHAVMVDPTSTGTFSIFSGATVLGTGTINLNDGVGSAQTLLFNEGTISAAYNPGGIIIAFNPPAGTLTLTTASANARIDLDGNSGAGAVNVFRNQTLQINGTLADGYGGAMALYHNSTFTINNPWTLDVGTIDVHTGAGGGIFGPAADTAYIGGATFTQTGGVITVVDNDGTLQFDAPFVMNGGSLINNGLVVFNNNATIGTLAHFTLPGTSSTASLTINTGFTVTVNQADFNVDGGGFAGNVLTINSGATLNLVNIGPAGDTTMDGTIHLNGGTFNVTTTTANWFIACPVSTGAGSGTSNITGDTLTLTGASISVANGSTLIFGAQTIWGGSLVVNAGGTVRLAAAANFNSASSFSGAGTLLFASAANFNVPTTLNLPSGTVDLAAGTGIFGQTITFNDNVTINASTLVSFGGFHFFGSDTLSIGGDGFKSLSVHLTDPTGEWTLDSSATLNIGAVGGNLGGGGIQGSDFLMAGAANISGNSIWTARTDISGVMTVNAASSMNFRGGTLADPNRLKGGTITGSGIARALNNQALVGFGVINTTVEFANNCELRADDGTLTINGIITDVGILGTADTDGVLLVTNVWNTSIATKVELKGGEIRGSQINNGGVGGIVGKGLVSARVINDTLLDANTAGTLIFQTGANNNDWDGGGNAGTLIATAGGTLELRDNADFPFLGSVSVSVGGTLFTNGFALNFQPGSSIQLINGTYMESLALNTTFGGTMSVAVAADSKLATSGSTGTFTFLSGSSTTLNGNLQLDAVLTVVQSGAVFSGAGSLINLASRSLAPDNLAVLNILLDNRGILTPAGTGVGRVDLHDFQQSITGNLAINLNGTGLNQFDRVIINGSALLNGQLAISLGGGFVPTLGNSFVILSATGGVAGIFSSVTPPGPVGLLHFVLDPTYNSNNVTLTVTQAYYEIQSGPYPQNFTGSGYQLWKTTSGTATITGNSSFTGTTTVFGGMLIVNSQNALGAGGLGLTPGTTVQLGSGLGLVVKLPFLSVPHTGSTYTGKLDLTDARFILQSTGGADKTTKLIDLNNALIAGASGGDWTGPGITSSTAAADSGHYGVGLFDNAILALPSLGGQTMDVNSLLVAIAHLGDANRNAVVDIQDQSIITNHWQSAQLGWSSGDLNRDGFVDLQDLTLVTNNWQQVSIYTLVPDSSGSAAITPVPEPASLALLAAALLIPRRRRAPCL